MIRGVNKSASIQYKFPARLLVTSLLLAGSSLFASAAYAEDAAAPAPADAAAQAPAEAGTGEIVVTALKRNTRLQDTPLAISAVSGESLANSGISDVASLTGSVPSLRFVDSGPGQRRIVVRGIQSAGEPTVGIYYDESPLSGSVGTTSDAGGASPDFRMFDVERVEVLRGPQGTLFGSGSMGGTVRVIQEKPKLDRIEAAVNGSGEAVQHGKEGGAIQGMINIPIIEDKLAIRVVGFWQEYAGYVDNIYLNKQDINDGYSAGVRALVRWKPTDRLTVDLAANFQKVSTDSPRQVLETGQPWTTNARAASGNFDTDRLYSGTIHYDLDWATITAVSSYFDRDKITEGDVSNNFLGRDTAAGCNTYLLGGKGTCSADQLSGYLSDTRAIQSSSLYQPQWTHDWTNELRISSSGKGRFNWTAGVFYEDRKESVRSTLLLADPTTGNMLPFIPANIKYDRTIDDHLKQFAAFAELSYKIVSNLTFTAGMRYYDYSKDVGGRVDVGQIHYGSVPTAESVSHANEHGVIGKFNLSWQAKRGLLIYAQASQGFRPGGVNQVVGLPANLAPYQSDSLWDYEVGVKSTLARGVYLDVTGYRIDWDNIQIAGRTSGLTSVFGFVTNAGAARVYGVEASLTAELTRRLRFTADFGYTDAHLTEDQVSNYLAASTSTGHAGDHIPLVPRVTAGVSLEYTKPLTGELDLFTRIDGNVVGSSYSTISPVDPNRRRLPDYEVGNVRIGVRGHDQKWGAYFYVNNISDTQAIVSASTSSNTPGQTLIYTQPPRTYGINLSRKF